MNRDHRMARIAALTLAAAMPFAAGAARASEGNLELLPDLGMLAVLVLLFGALIYPVNNLILKPIFRVLDEREERIAGTRRRAEQLAADAEQTLQRYERAVREARQEAERERKQAVEAARSAGTSDTKGVRSEAESQVSHAREEMGTALAEARSVLRTQSTDLAREIASRALGRALS